VAEYEQMLVHAYPAATPRAIRRMAEHGVRQREDGRFVLKMDASIRGAVAGGDAPDAEAIQARHDHYRKEMWDALAGIPCPTLVVRGAASDIVGADVADRMVDDVLQNGQLAVVPRAGHSVMTDNPEAFAEAVGRFVLGE
jgi:pimeloyl-ACP methyl ester carboxylesterase